MRGIAHIMRTGWFKEVHVKSEDSYRMRLLLTQRRNLKRKFLDIENSIRHSIKTFGLKVGRVSRGQFEARVRELVAGDPLIAGLTDCMLRAPVHAGGQAVVGVVESPGGGDRPISEDQPQAKQIAHAPQPAVWSADKERQPLPVSGDAERPLPNARRDVPGRPEG